MNPARIPHRPLGAESVEALLDEHLRDPFFLGNKLADCGPAFVTELIRLALIGAVAEREAVARDDTRNAALVDGVAARWARLVGTP